MADLARAIACGAAIAVLLGTPARVHAQGGGLRDRGPCSADIDRDWTVSEADLFLFLEHWFSGQPAGDVTGDAEWTSDDVFGYLQDWFAQYGAGVQGSGCVAGEPGVSLVFVRRAIPENGSLYFPETGAMPGVGPHARTRTGGPGQLLIREPGGVVRALVDGSNPTAESLWLVDVNAPDVSFDGGRVVFAGLAAPPDRPGAAVDPGPAGYPGEWRIYSIRINGADLRQLTFDQIWDMTQFGPGNPSELRVDDFDPAYLPDGRIVFASTRYFSHAQYSGVRTSNLYVMRWNGADLYRITSERNGAERPTVDPATGRIVFSRWWRNHRFPSDDMSTVPAPVGPAVYGYDGPAYTQHMGLTDDRNVAPDQFRNFWQLASVNSDGSDLRMESGIGRDEPGSHVYGGVFDWWGQTDGFYGNFYPMFNMTEASGFGGVRRHNLGVASGAPGRAAPLLGVQGLTLDHVKRGGSGNGGGASFGVYWGNYASDAAPLPDGRVLVSWAPDIHQDYGLYIVSADGTGLERVYDAAGTSELRAKVILPRQAGATTQDMYKDRPWVARPWPQPPAGSDYARDGTFTFNALNVYFNAPVDTDIISAPAVGSAGSIRFFIDHQRKSPGSFGHIDWPVLLNERAVAADGSVTEPNAPANVPLFEQVRSKPGHGYRVPRTGGPYPLGSAHVTGMNYAPAGAVVSCVGCHAGHSMIPLPATAEGAKWTNLAPGAAVTVSSARDPNFTGGLIDRRVMKGEIWRYWNSAPDQPQDGQWAALTFSAPVAVRTVRLYNPRTGDEANSTLRVLRATVRLYADAGATLEVASVSVQPAGGLSVSGTDVSFADVRARVVKVTLDDIEGTFYGMRVASLAEVEVIGKGVE